MSLNSFFEKRFVFSLGRTVSNIVAIAGVGIVVFGFIDSHEKKEELCCGDANIGMSDISGRNSYSEFKKEVRDNRIKRVLIFPEFGKAVTVKTNESRYLVNLEPDENLLQLLTDNDVKIAVSNKPRCDPKCVDSEQEAHRWFDSFLAGIFAIIIGSVSSAVFSNERNTRKDN